MEVGGLSARVRTAARRTVPALRRWVAATRRSRLARCAAVAGTSVAGAVLGLALGAQVQTPVGPADVTLSARPALTGETVLNVAPLGKLSFDTHSSPLRVEATIEEIRMAAAEDFLEDPTAMDRLAGSVVEEVRDGAVALLARALGMAALGGGVVALLVFRDLRRAAWSTLGGAGCVVVVSAGAAVSFNPASVSEPRYTGLLVGAPQAFGDTIEVVDRIEEYQRQLAGLVVNVSQLYEAASALPDYVDEGESETIRALHVSDLHLNPAAWSVIRSLTNQFNVDLVLDSGDLTERGSAAEDIFADEISTLDVPYVWVRGNHDSMGTQRAVEAQENAIVLDGDTEEVAGLRVFGMGDPRFAPDQTQQVTEQDVRDLGAEHAAEVHDAAVAADEGDGNDGEQEDTQEENGDAEVEGVDRTGLDVVLVHDQIQAEAFSGLTPLVLAGSEHRRSDHLDPAGTQYLVQGSTGGAGLRGLEPRAGSPTPLQASVLYFDVDTGRLQARDDVDLGGLGLTSAQIERHVAQEPDRELTLPSQRPSPDGPTMEDGRNPGDDEEE
ncbi:metallophosphoesterase [Lipingzhangella sp. LS1_29]|uniref:Metallophosphoesterase n=1 Tax=Lipingzhangella rawalii TaxID=2055835 RepID=A0ABU2H8E6_9ACTN|nr:metallophosphoesterase [Lipingzhangella rawalii]MDS1271566.1 metallophosphoesterase [Lipingzhangella rawalii]